MRERGKEVVVRSTATAMRFSRQRRGASWTRAFAEQQGIRKFIDLVSMMVPTFRTGGGFSLTQRSPRPRLAHDNLPPAPDGHAPPKFLAQLMDRQAQSLNENASRHLQPQQQPPPLGSGRANSKLSHRFELDFDNGWAPTRRQNASAPGMDTTHRRPARTPRSLGRLPVTSAPPRAAQVEALQRNGGLSPPPINPKLPPTSLRAGSSPPPRRPPNTNTASSSCAVLQIADAKPSRALQGHAHKSPRAHRPAVADGGHVGFESRGNSRGSDGGVADGMGGGGGGSARSAGGRSPVRTGEGNGSPVRHNSPAEGHSVRPAQERPARASDMNQPQAGVGKDTVSCVPFPSMRHAHHLATINPPGLGGRFPPTAPENRDESALHRVSNYSIRPCIHDAQLAQRFGAKAARGMSYTGEGSGQIRPAGGGCGAASVTSSYSHSEPGHATSADVDVDSLRPGLTGKASLLTERRTPDAQDAQSSGGSGGSGSSGGAIRSSAKVPRVRVTVKQ